MKHYLSYFTIFLWINMISEMFGVYCILFMLANGIVETIYILPIMYSILIFRILLFILLINHTILVFVS